MTKDPSQVQYLVHGVGFDSRYSQCVSVALDRATYSMCFSYWDFTVDGSDTYSYVAAAANAGYTTFRYDRLGTGLSDHPHDAYK